MMMKESCTTMTAESRSLETILGSREAVAEFFDSVWQKSCGVFPRRSSNNNTAPDDDSSLSQPTTSSSWKEDKVLQNPYEELVADGWNVLINLLEEGERVNENDNSNPNNSDMTTTPEEHSTLPGSPHAAAASTPSPPSPPPPFRSYHQQQQQEKPLLFKNQNPLTLQEQEIHGGSLFSAFLDGCSIVTNHADLMSPWIAALCNDLQHSFPHAYANTYLTPPNCQTVPPHADDRDVFVIQIYGSKHWNVYKNIPIPYPYPNEQVGKGLLNLPVPDQVLHGPVLIQQTLKAGDVLYMPRGYVHEAQSVPDELSFHVTLALATHDWSLAGMLSTVTDQVVKSLVDYRMALPRQFGRGTWDDDSDGDNGTATTANGAATNSTTINASISSGISSIDNGMRVSIDDQQALQQQIDKAINAVREKFTARAVHENLKIKFQRHNERARVGRLEILERAKLQNGGGCPSSSLQPLKVAVVGLEAALRVNLHTQLRAATVQEKQQAQAAAACNNQNRAVGLHVREEIANDIIGILQYLKSGHNGVDNNTSSSCCCCRVGDLRSLLLLQSPPTASRNGTEMTAAARDAARAINPLICDLSLLCFARKCVEFGALAIVDQD